MKNLNVSLLSLFVIFVFIFSCEKSNEFENQWYSLDSKLKINNNKTFEFERFNSISSSISKGKWEVINDTLILNSFQTNKCYFIENFKLEPLRKNDKYIFIKTNKDCHPNQGYVIFKNEKFYLKDSILIYKSQVKIDDLILKNIYSFSRKNRYKY